MRIDAWWLALALPFFMGFGAVWHMAFEEPREVEEAWQEGYESGYYDAKGEEYEEPNVLLLVLPIVVMVGLVGLIVAAVKFKASKKEGCAAGDHAMALAPDGGDWCLRHGCTFRTKADKGRT